MSECSYDFKVHILLSTDYITAGYYMLCLKYSAHILGAQLCVKQLVVNI